MAPMNAAQLDAELEAGRIPFGECPGDGLVPVTVLDTAPGFRAECPMCHGTLNWFDVRWLGQSEAMDEGWAVMFDGTPTEKPRWLH
jgi:hypothetical protein